jgi:2-amino-4-hydroxy-6-hydroxymethyldihydropteridine diphosphokinase
VKVKIAFGIGSNLGNRASNLINAAEYLSKYLSNVKLSETFETTALLPKNAPLEWNIPYLNQVLCGEIAPHEPESLLTKCQEIEKNMGRIAAARWSPRIIDIDIVAIEGVIWHSETLQIPHPLAHNRHFVLEPLAQVWAEAILANGKTAAENMLELKK